MARCARLICGLAIFPIFCWALPAHGLEVIEQDRFYVYAAPAQRHIAVALLEACGPMAAFLETKGLTVQRPLHIILDDTLDRPQPRVHMIPHREIRIPIRAPGVLEDGFQEAHPWRYFLFMGLSTQGIYSERSGLPAAAHRLLGEIISPTIILPEWCIDGIGALLYEAYKQGAAVHALDATMARIGPIPALDRVSNHPDIWPGRFSYRIHGRPFVRWLNHRYGWERLHTFVRLHGRGVVPLEIDTKARAAFGRSWARLWDAYRATHPPAAAEASALPMTGYWNAPFIYWNDMGVHPGLRRNAHRGRYGHVDPDGWLYISQFDADGVSRLQAQRGDRVRTASRPHIWDPGPGDVAVTREGHRPLLMIGTPIETRQRWLPGSAPERPVTLIPPPEGMLQLSGPVMGPDGTVAVAGNMGGQWDIWCYDGRWQNLTDRPAIDLDPWFENGRLFFSSNAGGRFQIHDADDRPVTAATTAAMLPRGGTYVELSPGGWTPLPLPQQQPTADASPTPDDVAYTNNLSTADGSAMAETMMTPPAPEPYRPFRTLGTNYISPDIFYDAESTQFGLVTDGRDVTEQYAWNAGIRYSLDHALLSWRFGAGYRGWEGRATHYPLDYTTHRGTAVAQRRYDVRLSWSPWPGEALDVGLNWRRHAPLRGEALWSDEWWGSLGYGLAFGNLRLRLTGDLFDGGDPSVYGDILYWFGERITTITRLRAGKAWGDPRPGHNTFRIGGNTSEGFFTQRPTRLFPLRGFQTNLLEAEMAAAGTLEIVWPLMELQSGYKSLPLFLRNLRLGTFVDAGFAADNFSGDELLIGAGFQLITGMEIAWGFMADFSVGLAWPVKQPDDMHYTGPQFLIQIGRPL